MPNKSYQKLSPERLIAIIKERIHEEKQDIERYELIWKMVIASKMPTIKVDALLDALNRIVADEEIHAEMLKDALKIFTKY